MGYLLNCQGILSSESEPEKAAALSIIFKVLTCCDKWATLANMALHYLGEMV